MEEINKLKLHNSIIIYTGFMARRVINGLMYTEYDNESSSSIFVPYDNFDQ